MQGPEPNGTSPKLEVVDGSPSVYWPRLHRWVYQAFFLMLFVATLVLMTEEGIRRFPVQWIFHLDPLAALSADDRECWSDIGGGVARLDDGVADIDGHYGAMLDAYGCDAIIKRPDQYIFGTCPTLADLPAAIAELRDQLGAD